MIIYWTLYPVPGTKRKNKNPWVPEDTWNKVEERKKIKKRQIPRKQTLYREHYKKHRDLQYRFRKDSRVWAKNLATEAESARTM